MIRYTTQSFLLWKTKLKEIPMNKPAAILDGLEVSEVVLTDVRKAIDAHVRRGSKTRSCRCTGRFRSCLEDLRQGQAQGLREGRYHHPGF